MKLLRLLIIWMFFLSLSSCKKDTIILPEPEPEKHTSLKVNYRPLLNGQELIFNRPKLYTNAFGDSLNVNVFKYYISNLVLVKEDASVYIVPESYYFINHGFADKQSFDLSDLPEGNYTKMEFLIGIDSARNCSGAQDGALSPENEMFWDWNQGYIFFKLEGEFKSINKTSLTQYNLHVGGFSYPTNYIRKCSLNFPSALHVQKGQSPVIYINTVIDEVFKNPNLIDLDTYYNTTGGKFCGGIADNYPDMFVIDHIEN